MEERVLRTRERLLDAVAAEFAACGAAATSAAVARRAGVTMGALCSHDPTRAHLEQPRNRHAAAAWTALGQHGSGPPTLRLRTCVAAWTALGQHGSGSPMRRLRACVAAWTALGQQSSGPPTLRLRAWVRGWARLARHDMRVRGAVRTAWRRELQALPSLIDDILGDVVQLTEQAESAGEFSAHICAPAPSRPALALAVADPCTGDDGCPGARQLWWQAVERGLRP